MAELKIVTWLWGDKYPDEYPIRLAAGIRRHLRQALRLILITDRKSTIVGFDEVWPIPDEDLPLLAVPGCFVRLRMFDPAWQAAHGVTDRMVCIDLDSVITGPLDPLFDRPEPFVILQGGNSNNPCPYGGALMMLRPGVHSEVWSEFSLDAAAKIPRHEFPDDQGWIAHSVHGATGWKCGPSSGVYVFRKPTWPASDLLPADARLVTFNGWRNPKTFKNLDWVRKHWV